MSEQQTPDEDVQEPEHEEVKKAPMEAKLLVGILGVGFVAIIIGCIFVVWALSQPSTRNDAVELPTSRTPVSLPVRALPLASSASDKCLTAMRKADGDETAMRSTLTACTSMDEWAYALTMYPGATALTPGTTITELEIQTACYKVKGTPVCTDARAQGYVS